MGKAPPAQPPLERADIVNLLLLTLKFLRDATPDVVGRSGYSAMHTLCFAGLITDEQRSELTADRELLHLLAQKSYFIRGAARPRKAELRQIAATKAAPLAILVAPDQAPLYRKFLGTSGYPLLITNAGMTYAASIADQYKNIFDLKIFHKAWQQYLAAHPGRLKRH